MGYIIPQHALNNLKKYSYKGVDKYAFCISPKQSLKINQVSHFELCSEPFLDMVCHIMATINCPEHGPYHLRSNDANPDLQICRSHYQDS